jgi:hypothetical protein
MQTKTRTADSIVVGCLRCKEEWRLSPNKWTNLDTVKKIGKKRVICPFCNYKMLLNKKQTNTLLKQRIKKGGIS